MPALCVLTTSELFMLASIHTNIYNPQILATLFVSLTFLFGLANTNLLKVNIGKAIWISGFINTVYIVCAGNIVFIILCKSMYEYLQHNHKRKICVCAIVKCIKDSFYKKYFETFINSFVKPNNKCKKNLSIVFKKFKLFILAITSPWTVVVLTFFFLPILFHFLMDSLLSFSFVFIPITIGVGCVFWLLYILYSAFQNYLSSFSSRELQSTGSELLPNRIPPVHDETVSSLIKNDEPQNTGATNSNPEYENIEQNNSDQKDTEQNNRKLMGKYKHIFVVYRIYCILLISANVYCLVILMIIHFKPADCTK